MIDGRKSIKPGCNLVLYLGQWEHQELVAFWTVRSISFRLSQSPSYLPAAEEQAVRMAQQLSLNIVNSGALVTCLMTTQHHCENKTTPIVKFCLRQCAVALFLPVAEE